MDQSGRAEKTKYFKRECVLEMSKPKGIAFYGKLFPFLCCGRLEGLKIILKMRSRHTPGLGSVNCFSFLVTLQLPRPPHFPVPLTGKPQYATRQLGYQPVVQSVKGRMIKDSNTSISALIPLMCGLYTKTSEGTSLVVQRLGLCAPSVAGPGSIPGRGTRSHMLQDS